MHVHMASSQKFRLTPESNKPSGRVVLFIIFLFDEDRCWF